MKKTTLILLISSIIFLGIIFIIFFKFQESITGNMINDFYSYTKAICNETNFCEDYEITCEKNKITEITSTGVTIQHSNNWENQKKENLIENLCE